VSTSLSTTRATDVVLALQMSRCFGQYAPAHPWALKRSKGMDVLFLVLAEGEAFLAWPVPTSSTDSGRRLQEWLRAWELEIGACVS